MATTNIFTAADLMDLEDDGYRYELIEGELERMAPATLEHAWIESRCCRLLGGVADSTQAGAVFASSAGYVFGRNPDTVLAPDVSFVRADRLPPGSEWRAFAEVAPDVVVEIISPSERKAHLDRTSAIYLRAGVRLVWFVDPRRRAITVFAPGQEPAALHERDHLDGGDVLPGCRVPVAECFPPTTA